MYSRICLLYLFSAPFKYLPHMILPLRTNAGFVQACQVGCLTIVAKFLVTVIRHTFIYSPLTTIGRQGIFTYDRPEILPSASTSMMADDGIFGRPGMVITSPQIITTYSAPAARRTSRTFIEWPDGAPRNWGSVENEYWVLATQTGK